MGEARAPAPELRALWDELGGDGPQVGILLSSPSDREVMEPAATELSERGISYEVRTLPPHGDPRGVAEYASTAALRGVRVIIASSAAGAGLAGVVASYSELPVIGVPIRSPDVGGLDALLSTVQMPAGTPVGCMAINGATNAAVYAARILAQGAIPPPPDE